ncbi:GTP-binding protein EngA [hydrothermal vent metagenome]|uniref:GTP-binding protein EngA n=1 Tax=hydrothermal vent metagenome TaxID=652676 RepID=A0A3B0TD53_9ZZZZ
MPHTSYKKYSASFGFRISLKSVRSFSFLSLLLIIGFFSCKSDDSGGVVTDVDTDGDGILDKQEIADGTNKNNACDPAQNSGYTGFDSTNAVWSASDCDGDGVTNGDEISNSTDPYLDDTVFAIPEFLPKLSELLLFQGDMSDLKLNNTVHEYSLTTKLYTDYAYKLRSISIPDGAQMVYNGEGLLSFPDNTILAKTFYYFIDERNPSLGRKIIETRVLIKQNGSWEMGNYLWNDEQTDALLDLAGPIVTVNWIDNTGANRSVDYQVPIMLNCIQCHDNSGANIPIGPKVRAMNFVHNGTNLIQNFKDIGLLSGAPDIAQIETLPTWSDDSFTLEERARAYMDVNCAHCHQPGGLHDSNMMIRPDFRYETTYNDSNIDSFKVDIKNRVNISPAFGPSMPLVGITELHVEGVQLIQDYIDSLN